MKIIWVTCCICFWTLGFSQDTLKKMSNAKPNNLDETIFINSEIPPIWGSCAIDSLNQKEIRQCSNEELLAFIYGNFKLPKRFKAQCNFHIRTVFQFEIDKDGVVGGLKFPIKIDPEIKLEIIRIMKDMPKWIPGTQFGVPVKVQYTMPFRFTIL